ncbi:MBL fold metallo-hydrolase [Frigoribacterium sp. R86507]|uniref:MBL fold metallo-hydrolase n=1 Tax=Frigoribacterium sp. R86507 TaxID=3093850 RepID=UPI0037C82091
MTTLDYTVLDSGDTALEKTLTLVTGDTEAVLVDAGFTRSAGHRAVAAILDSGKTLTTVFIGAGDPDFYFGAEVVQDAFPSARFVAPAAVIEHIEHSYEGKLEAWASLGENLPTRKVELTAFEGDHIAVDDATLEVRHADVDPADRGWYLFDADSRSLLGGILVFGGLHVWTADTATVQQRALWTAALDEFEALDPTLVVAGHRDPAFPADVTAIRHTRDYLAAFDAAVADHDTAEEAEKALQVQYPGAGLGVAAHLGTRVAKGEMTWG